MITLEQAMQETLELYNRWLEIGETTCTASALAVEYFFNRILKKDAEIVEDILKEN